MMKICVVGDTGLLGQACVRNYSREHSLLGVSTSAVSPIPNSASYSHFQCDVSQEPGVFLKKIDEYQPVLLINCAALADIALCEQHPDKAFRLNAVLPEQLATIARDCGAGFIHISTDAFFGGPTRKPHNESEIPCPLNVYGRTKFEGEQRALCGNPDTLVVRTNLVGFRNRKDAPTFGEWLCHALCEGKDISLADDFVASSIHADYLTDLMLRAQLKDARGLLNIVSRDAASKYLFGELLAEAMGSDFSHVRKVQIRDLNLVPRRAPYIALDVAKGESFLGERFPEIRSTVHRLAEDFKTLQQDRGIPHG